MCVGSSLLRSASRHLTGCWLVDAVCRRWTTNGSLASQTPADGSAGCLCLCSWPDAVSHSGVSHNSSYRFLFPRLGHSLLSSCWLAFCITHSDCLSCWLVSGRLKLYECFGCILLSRDMHFIIVYRNHWATVVLKFYGTEMICFPLRNEIISSRMTVVITHTLWKLLTAM